MSTEELDYTHWRDSTGAPLTKRPDRLGVATNGFIRDKTGKILLQQRADNGFWGLPGGQVELGESVEQGVVREVYEETGLQVRVERLIGVYSGLASYPFMRYPNGTVVHYLTVVFACDPVAAPCGSPPKARTSATLPPTPYPHRPCSRTASALRTP